MQHRTGFGSPLNTQAVNPLIEVFPIALAFFQQGKLSEAYILCAEILQKNPNHFDALHLSGVIASQSRKFDEAEAFYAKAMRINPKFAPLSSNFAVLYSNRGNILNDVKRFDEALVSYDKAISIKSDHADAFNNRGVTLHELKRFDEALASYDKAISIKPDHAAPFNNRGATLQELKRFDEALANYDKAISIQPDYAEAFNNRGNTLKGLKRFDEALASYDKAISIKPDYAEAFNNRGSTLEELRRFDEALASYGKAISIRPDYEWLFGSWLNIRMQTSEWSDLERLKSELKAKIRNGEDVISPFRALDLFDDLKLFLMAARNWTDKKFKSNPLAATFEKRSISPKIRIGYFSADFHNHATAYLMAELFERHDRDKFELFAFSFGPDQADEMRKRLEASFDKFIDIRFNSDQEVAALSRTLGIDIAVDLKGFTQDSRTGIFAYRCAPIQVNYIGYPGTMSADYIDYIIADRILIPVESQRFYSEKIVYLPDSYQVNDSKREISNKTFTRAKSELPEEGFVFCCFNNSYKILPDVFQSWMRILKSVEGSVLWLLDDNDTSTRNLRREASNRGVSPNRLVFAKRMPLADHLARHRSADLFLDTLPYNAHTTASDALWAGVPVLTRIGQSFAARVAASLLNAVGLPELITTSVDEYEQLAVNLATHPDEMKRLKRKLADNRLSSKLFDTPLFARHLEAAYTSMYQRYQDGLEPDHIHVQEETKTAG